MRYFINIDSIKKQYRFNDTLENGKKSLQHNSGKEVSIFPYNVNYKKSDRTDIINFRPVLGEFTRRITGMKVFDRKNTDSILIDAAKQVDMNQELITSFKGIIKELFYKNNELQVFHPTVFNYIEGSNEFNRKLGQYLFDVLYVKEIGKSKKMEWVFDSQPQNLLLKIVKDALPKLEKINIQDKPIFLNCIKFIGERFNKDLEFMLSKPRFFVDYFDLLLKYYYFFYTSQLSLKLGSMFDADVNEPDKLFFNLSWESTSKSRISFTNGWSKLEPQIKKMFSHANCLELLNHNDIEEKYSYTSMKSLIEQMSDYEKEHFDNQVNLITVEYQKYVEDVDWQGFKSTDKYDDNIYNSINKLFNSIEYQFNESGRKGKSENYCEWFIEFCRQNFLKKRGPLGDTLNITEDNVLFITKLCIGDRDKLKIKNLFEEYEYRGIYFDRDSQIRIIQFFEKLNLLEKKSDSGDAQYVKSIL